jgi:hypothetical protein
MFFPDPVSAFRHLHGALRADGRLAFVCWAPLADNPWARVPFEAAASVLGRPEPDVPDAPGPFSFGDQARVRRILEGAGYRHVTSESFTTRVAFGSRDDAARELARLGPVARLLVDRDEASVEKVLNAIRAVLPTATNAAGATEFDAAAWVVTAGA